MKRDTSRFHVNALVDPRAVDDPATLFDLVLQVLDVSSRVRTMGKRTAFPAHSSKTSRTVSGGLTPTRLEEEGVLIQDLRCLSSI